MLHNRQGGNYVQLSSHPGPKTFSDTRRAGTGEGTYPVRLSSRSANSAASTPGCWLVQAMPEGEIA